MAILKFEKVADQSEQILKYLASTDAKDVRELWCSQVFCDKDAESLQTALSENHERMKLEALKLPNNGFTANGARSIAGIVHQTESLRELDLSDNQVKDKGLSYLVENALAISSCRLHSLNLSNNKLGSKGASLIASLLRTNNHIRTLLISHNTFGRSIKTFGPYLGKLHTLDLSQNRLGDKGAHTIGEVLMSPECRLEYLNLSNNRIGYQGAYSLADGFVKGHNKSVKVLNLTDNSIEQEGAEAFGVVLMFCHTLEELNLSRNMIGDEGVRGLMTGLTRSQDTGLRILDLSWNGIKDEGAGRLASMLMDNSVMTHLSLKSNAIRDAGMRSLARSLRADMALQELNLIGNQMEDPSPFVDTICHYETKLQTLLFDQNKLDEEAEDRIRDSFAFRTNLKGWLGKLLREIEDKRMVNFDLIKKNHGDAEISAIAKGLAKHGPSVRTAVFGKKSVTWRSIRILSSEVLARNTSNLERLFIEGARIGDEGAEALALGLETNRTLSCLSLKNCGIGVDGAKHLAHALSKQKKLQRLGLEQNHIGDEGFLEICRIAFAVGSNHPSLVSLNVASNGIGDAGLANLVSIDRLENLRLDGNPMTDYGALDIAKAVMENTTLQWLNLRKTSISAKGAIAIKMFLHIELVLDADVGH